MGERDYHRGRGRTLKIQSPPILRDVAVPDYGGLEWNPVELPSTAEAWPKFGTRGLTDFSGEDYDVALEEAKAYARGKPCIWPRRTLYFFCDIHADADAFLRSLVASGGINLTGAGDRDFELTEEGAQSLFVMGGDCFDKGPENLRLLRVLGSLIEAGAEVEILAGNHDLRTLVGLAYIGRKEPRFAHLFVRMGKKTMPLFQEIHRQYLPEGATTGFDQSELEELLFPSEDWYERFPDAAQGLIPPLKIEKEVRRIREKTGELVEACEQLGMSLGQVHAAAMKARELFMEPGGEFHWYFDRMVVARKWGSFLLVHAGVCDITAKKLAREGVDGLNRWFHELLLCDLFELYNGPVGNVFRTKYREFDWPFTDQGVRDMHDVGIYGIVHGHRNILRGQRLRLHNGLLNVECDVSVDANTRSIEGLEGPGAGVFVFRPDGRALGISSDYHHVKVLDVASVFPHVIIS